MIRALAKVCLAMIKFISTRTVLCGLLFVILLYLYNTHKNLNQSLVDIELRRSNVIDSGSKVLRHRQVANNVINTGSKVLRHRQVSPPLQSSCRLSRFSLSQNPRLKMNQNKFLLPLLRNGPNNQIIGMRDAIFLSVALNRTLILPDFFQHKTNSEGKNSPVSAEERLDVTSLSSFLSIKSKDEFDKVCRGQVNAVFLTSLSKWMVSGPPYHLLAGLTDIHSLHKTNNLPIYPKTEEDTMISSHQGSRDLMRRLYGSEERCALYVYPFHSVGVRESAQALRRARSLLFNNTPLSVDDLEPELLYSLGYASSPRPRFITEIANSFLTQVVRGNRIIAAHWRFDQNDWMLRCAKQGVDGKETQIVVDICNKLNIIKPPDIARGILSFRDEHFSDVDGVYLAAPLTLTGLIKEVRDVFASSQEKRKVNLFTFIDLKNHLNNYLSCSSVRDNFEDVLSLVEMEICLLASSFLSSATSSWSSNVVRDRLSNKNAGSDGDVLDVAWRAHSSFLNSDST